MKYPYLILLVLAAASLVLSPMQASALAYSELLQSQTSSVLGETENYPYDTGQLVNDNGTVYFIYDTTKIPFTSREAFLGLGYAFGNVVKGNLSNYRLASSYLINTDKMEHPWGSWLLYNGTVYYSSEEGLIGVSNWETFLNNGGEAKQIIQANSYDINTLNSKPKLSLLSVNDTRVSRHVTQTDQQPSTLPADQSQNQQTLQPNQAQPSQTAYFQKKALVFSIDQTWINGIVNAQDTVSLNRIISTLKQFQNKYEVYAILSPSHGDQSKIFTILDILSANGINFILDQQSSDMNHKDSVISPHDPYHGIALSLDQLKAYKAKYGDKFAGIRFMESFAANYTILACQQLGVNWCDYDKTYLPTDNFYQKSIAEPYIKFAKDNKMFVLWSDFYWAAYHPWDFDVNVAKQPQNEQELKELIAAYPGTIMVVLANNWPADGARSGDYINTWQNTMKPFVDAGAIGFGLSDQSWMCSQSGGCPASEIAGWATTAFANGAKLVQFEPVQYLWNLPEGTMEKWVTEGQNPTDYPQDPAWADRGYPKANLVAVASGLGVNITSNEVIKENGSTCLAVNAPDMVKPGQAFSATVTVKNTGSKPWVAQNSEVSWQVYKLGALDLQLPPYTSSKWGTADYALQEKTVVNPGEQTTFTLSPTAPTTEGTYDFSWQMFEHGIEWFGDTCTRQISVSNEVPSPTNATAVCPAPGNQATISWTAPAGYNKFYLRVKKWPHPTDGSAIYWNDNFNGTSYSFSTTPGQEYNWWVHTKDTASEDYSDAAGSTFTCSH